MDRAADDSWNQHEAHGLRLVDELTKLADAAAAGLGDAVIFYAARLLEATSHEAARREALDPSGNAFANLCLLQDHGALPEITGSWAHALRRLGNDARHILRPLSAVDGRWGLLFLERWLGWYAGSILGAAGPTVSLADGGSVEAALLDELEAGADLRALADGAARDSRFTGNPIPPGVLCERLLATGEVERALAVAVAARTDHGEDRRLRQLHALALGRAGDLEGAWALIDGDEDDEGFGIAAGIAKRRWDGGSGGATWLERSRGLYARGWKRSRGRNAYLGINAATTALWAGRAAQARELAVEVRTCLERRAAALAAVGRAMGYWDRVTLAEALLLGGERTLAADAYAAAAAVFPDEAGNHAVAAAQAARIDALLTGGPAAMPAPPAAPPDAERRLAISGHRTLTSEAWLATRIAEGLVLAADGATAVTLITGLADGADRLVPAIAAELALPHRLHALLPFERGDYEDDFAPASRADFRAQLARCHRIGVAALEQAAEERRAAALDGVEHGQRVAGYRVLGEALAAGCDALLAVWDGEPAHGPGGTAEVVAAARALGREVVWVSATEDRPPRRLEPTVG